MCSACDGDGFCEACSDGIDKVGNECENLQQAALDAIASELRKISGKSGCAAPDVLTCGSTCTGTGCGTFTIAINDEKRVVELFVLLVIQYTTHMSIEINSNGLTSIPSEIGYLTGLTHLESTSCETECTSNRVQLGIFRPTHSSLFQQR